MFELGTVLLISRVVGADFLPEGFRVVHVIEMGELVNNYVVTELFGHLHEADIERDSTVTTATSPSSSGVAEAAFVIFVAV